MISLYDLGVSTGNSAVLRIVLNRNSDDFEKGGAYDRTAMRKRE